MHPTWYLPAQRLQALVDGLIGRGFRVVGPVVRDGTIVYDTVGHIDELATGLCDEQDPGRYRLASAPGAVFGVVNGAGSLKPFFFAPEEPLLTARRRRSGFAPSDVLPAASRVAVLGARPCDLAALAIQDHIFLAGPVPDGHYGTRRAGAFLVAVNCTRAAPTCFCASMGTGPTVHANHDLALTTLDDGFVVASGSSSGEALVHDLGLATATAAQVAEAQQRLQACAANLVRQLDTRDLHELLYAQVESPHWDDVARRCLSCGNCTMVCPTCFCHTVIDTTALDGSHSDRIRVWDSCFAEDHARIHGRNFRVHVRERYRQWLTHKLASWIEQFGTSGCVGCGRCITWCPAGIDLTVEVAAIRATPDQEGRI